MGARRTDTKSTQLFPRPIHDLFVHNDATRSKSATRRSSCAIVASCVLSYRRIKNDANRVSYANSHPMDILGFLSIACWDRRHPTALVPTTPFLLLAALASRDISRLNNWLVTIRALVRLSQMARAWRHQ